MYNKIKELLLEALSGSSRAYRKAYRKMIDTDADIIKNHDKTKTRDLIKKNSIAVANRRKIRSIVPQKSERQVHRAKIGHIKLVSGRIEREVEKKVK